MPGESKWLEEDWGPRGQNVWASWWGLKPEWWPGTAPKAPSEAPAPTEPVPAETPAESPSTEPPKAPKKGVPKAKSVGRKSTTATKPASKKAHLPQPLGNILPAKNKPPQPKGPPPKRARRGEAEPDYEVVSMEEEAWYKEARQPLTEVKQEPRGEQGPEAYAADHEGAGGQRL